MDDSGGAVAVMSSVTGPANGAVRNGDNTQPTRTVAGRRGGTLTPFDSARALEANRKRWAKVGHVARRALVTAAGEVPDLDVQGDHWRALEYVFHQRWLNTFDPSARGSSADLRTMIDVAFPKPERDPAAAVGVPAGGAALALSPELAQQLLTAMRERRQQGE